PVDAGSGGGYLRSSLFIGPGGGYLRLTVAGELVLDGVISANGSRALGQGAGGGSGGGIWITAKTVSGAGGISVDGGAGALPMGGGGGGGCLAIYYFTNNFVGRLSARGGAGANYGGAGTIYQKINETAFGRVVADNGGQAATNTPLQLLTGQTYDLSV